jgi:hypothetical protein
MKKEINTLQRFKAISRVMETYAAAFEEKNEVQTARNAFGSNNEKIGELFALLLRPVATVRSPRQDSERRMRKALSQMIGIGLTLATSQDNQPLIAMLRNYDTQWKRGPAYQLHEIGMHVYDELSKLQPLAIGNGLTEEKMTAFLQMAQAYTETVDSTGFQLSDRRKCRLDLKSYIKANNQLLRLQLDTFVRFSEDEYPELFSNYMFLRKRKSSKSKPVSLTDEPAEISGTVTNSATGLPVPNATINIIDYNLIALTDIDGCFVIDDLEPGTYLVHCYAANFQVPDAVTATAEPDDSLVIDFSLQPVPAEPVPVE